MNDQDLHIIIIGGGIGGLCLAQGLKKAGINFTVFEKNKDNDTWLEGYRIHVNSVGSNPLYQCLSKPHWEAFLAGTADEKDGFAFMTEQLKELVFIDEVMMTAYAKEPQNQQYAAGRKMLRQVLQAGLDEHIIYNKTFLKYEQHENGKVKVVFEDDTEVWGDLLIGADGANSKVRSQLLPHAKRVTTNAVAIAGKTILNENSRVWLPDVITSRMNVIMPLKKYFFFSAAFDHQIKNKKFRKEIEQTLQNANIKDNDFFEVKENYILWAFIAHKKEFQVQPRHNADDLKNMVLEKTADWHLAIKGLIKEADPNSMIFLPFKVMLPIKNWQATNVTLLGDAVHNMPPLYGMGANMAMHDALLLLKQLEEVHSGKKTLSSALKHFQEQMLKDGFEALNISMKYTKQAISYNPVNRFFSHLWFRLCQAVPAIKQFTFGKRWVKED